eukprot:m51a1_g4562 putative rho gtpase (196) ;mRNA; r:119486-120422
MTDKQFVKLVVVGDGAVGKTCMLIAYANNKFPEKYIPTVFDNYIVNLHAGGDEIELGLWDTAGQEEYDRLRPLSYAGCNVFLVCFSVISSISLENVTSKWLPEITHFCPGVPHILVGTKSDARADKAAVDKAKQQGQTVVSPEHAQELAKKFKSVRFVECSAKTGENLKTVFDEAVKAVLLRKVKKSGHKGCSLL